MPITVWLTVIHNHKLLMLKHIGLFLVIHIDLPLIIIYHACTTTLIKATLLKSNSPYFIEREITKLCFNDPLNIRCWVKHKNMTDYSSYAYIGCQANINTFKFIPCRHEKLMDAGTHSTDNFFQFVTSSCLFKFCPWSFTSEGI